MFHQDDEKVHTLSDNQMVLPSRPKYGKMVVLYDDKFLITLGPDYLCFLPTFIIFFIVSAVMINLVLKNAQSFSFALSSIVICGGTTLAYLAVALSNPGIVTQETSLGKQDTLSQNQRMCKYCGFRVKPKTYHCGECNVCVEGYDHHCPWTSKCIGRGNIVRFYVFLIMVPIFMIYIFLALGTVMATQMQHSNVRHIRGL